MYEYRLKLEVCQKELCLYHPEFSAICPLAFKKMNLVRRLDQLCKINSSGQKDSEPSMWF